MGKTEKNKSKVKREALRASQGLLSPLFRRDLNLKGRFERMKKSKEPARNRSDARITGEQLSRIKKLRMKLGWKPEDLIERVKKLFSTEDVLSLNPTMAETLPDNLLHTPI